MEAITGVFETRSGAEHALQSLHQAGIPSDKLTLLTPGSADQIGKEIQSVPTDSTEQPGMGNAVGALMGGGVGLAGGAILMALVPGLGPVTALGLLGAGILTAAGATIGGVAGGKAENATYEGLPEDEIFVYEDALRKGRSVVVALTDDEPAASSFRDLMKREGAESVDAAREQWWTGLRDAEQSRYANTRTELFQRRTVFPSRVPGSYACTDSLHGVRSGFGRDGCGLGRRQASLSRGGRRGAVRTGIPARARALSTALR